MKNIQKHSKTFKNIQNFLVILFLVSALGFSMQSCDKQEISDSSNVENEIREKQIDDLVTTVHDYAIHLLSLDREVLKTISLKYKTLLSEGQLPGAVIKSMYFNEIGYDAQALDRILLDADKYQILVEKYNEDIETRFYSMLQTDKKNLSSLEFLSINNSRRDPSFWEVARFLGKQALTLTTGCISGLAVGCVAATVLVGIEIYEFADEITPR